MYKYLALFLLYFPFSSNLLFAQDSSYLAEKADKMTIAFGSCNKQDAPQPLWDDIIAHEPDVFLFLGDNIYGDTEDMQIMKGKYDLQYAHPEYAQLRAQTKIVGVWDDHDYGKNDAGKEFDKKEESQQLLLDFFDVPKDSPLRSREGVYSANTVKVGEHLVKIILLDARYHRDKLKRVDKVYQPNKSGSILGKEQWKWLEQELSDKDVSLYIIASGIQFIPEDHRFEKWANFPNERQKLFDLIASSEAKGTLLLSGDRHIAEISVMDWSGLHYPLVDFTSSGMTHTWSDIPEEYNRHREGDIIAALNYGLLNLSVDEAGNLKVNGEIRGDQQKLLLKKNISFTK